MAAAGTLLDPSAGETPPRAAYPGKRPHVGSGMALGQLTSGVTADGRTPRYRVDARDLDALVGRGTDSAPAAGRAGRG